MSTPSEPVAQLAQPLTSSELAMLGFETMTWASIWNPATLAQSTLHSEGQYSLQISNIGYTAVRHTPALTSDGNTFSVVGYDVRIPPLNQQPNPWWFGDTWLYIDAPSKGIHQVTLGTKPLQNPGQFTRVEFAIPTWIRTALSGSYSDLTFTIAINTTPGNAAHYLDRFTLGPGTCVPTDDGNPCTEDSCNAAGQPIHTPKPAGTSCSDSDQCNGAEQCNATGACQPGTPPIIDDGNPCTTDSCTPATGVAHVPVAAGTSCSDANACNGAEQCNATAICTPGTAPPIDDGNPCTADSCDATAGVQHVALPSGAACANGDACDGAEVCDANGVCQAGTPPIIDDGNPCTIDSCDPEEGVLHVPASAGMSCSDANACNGSEICNGAGGCAPGTPPAIDDGNPCTADSCDPVTGVAHSPLPSGTTCADADLCNGTELCNSAGICVAGSPSTIDDGNPCTADSCDPVTGVAHVPVPAGTSCADGDVCNGAEACSASAVCQPGSPLDPDDDNPCTIDACDPVAGVQHQPTPGASCADSDVCNGAEVCSSAGACTAGSPLDPDDQNPCTADSCDPVSGVANVPVAGGTSCSDDNVCNGTELCNASGGCQPSPPLDADDQNPCTADSCDPINGIENTPEPAGTSCSDGDVCTGGELCDGAGTCDPGAPLDPDDGNPCTEDSCDPVAGVVHSPVTDGTVCNDNDACTQADSCQGGACTGTDTVVCTAQDQCHGAGSCDPATGACSSPPLADGATCDDGDACTQVDSCQSGTCLGTDPVVCAPQGECMSPGSCDSATGVCSNTQLPDGSSCDDASACTTGDSCVSGACAPGSVVDPNDGNPCTVDSCDPVAGVSHIPREANAPCPDGNVCNGEEVCDGAATCQPGTALPAGTTCGTGEQCDESGACLPLIPPDPSGVAPPLDPTIPTDFMAIVDFLLTGDPPIQTGITPGRLIPERAALVRGRVTDRDGAPLPGVRVSASDHPEWGQTFTQATGKYELVVNGGSYVRVRFEGTGLLPAERKPQVRWNQFEVLDDVVLLSLSQEATVVDLNSSEPQLAVGESMIDAAGTRRASVIFPAGTGATMTLPDGAVVDMTELTFRATEYTVGPEGKRAMPAELPATSAYTYAVELSADEALAAGASAVSFDQPVVVYVDNFLDFPWAFRFLPVTLTTAGACGFPTRAEPSSALLDWMHLEQHSSI